MVQLFKDIKAPCIIQLHLLKQPAEENLILYGHNRNKTSKTTSAFDTIKEAHNKISM